jgi:hypothetical protein
MHHSAIQAACGRVNPLLLILPDAFVVKSLQRQHQRRGGQRQTKRPRFTWDQLRGMGLYRLMDTVKYPTQATPRRSSLSRVPENGMHGLKGEIRNGLA